VLDPSARYALSRVMVSSLLRFATPHMSAESVRRNATTEISNTHDYTRSPGGFLDIPADKRDEITCEWSGGRRPARRRNAVAGKSI
jgi:hypothetical protein